MGKEFVVLQGKTFYVDRQSMLGSTNYGWCVKSMPQELMLMGMANIPLGEGTRISPVIQRFYFGVVSAENVNVEIDFVLTNLSDLSDVTDEFKANIRIVPSDSEEYAEYSENDPNLVTMYGITYTGDQELTGACLANVQEANLKYGYICGVQEAGMKYGYPCGVQDANLKYGYPCGVQEAGMKYGYPCGVQEANLKYGYPCGVQEAGMKYGYPCGVQDANLKYGYPCGVQEANYKYGFPCMEFTKDISDYGLPFMK